jgi:hypothetical protein
MASPAEIIREGMNSSYFLLDPQLINRVESNTMASVLRPRPVVQDRVGFIIEFLQRIRLV